MSSSSSSSSSINRYIFSVKLIIFTALIASIATAVQFTVPYLPTIYSVINSSLKPPYLYLLINVIILTIALTSRFHIHNNNENQNQSQPLIDDNQVTPDLIDDSVMVYDSVPSLFQEVKSPVVGVEIVPESSRLELISPESCRPELSSPESEKPLVASRFAQKKPLKTSPDGNKSLRVTKPKKHETFENTWKTITNGRHVPLTRHLRKSETVENYRHYDVSHQNKKTNIMKKSVTLQDRTNYDKENHRPPSQISSPASSGKSRKEGSLSHDELNRRVEAFIKKFNDDMRQQRQESVKQYKEMTYRGPR
ncbi:uncharacterized protein [Rutidosis leptorrhynchoides]|uniref:uncharacterized protein n=1 Tax=Rutidosis leptorrhynchoides TaxID=125765 RepID=UPI003A998891